MKVTLSTVNGDVYVLDVPPDMELENFKALAESEVGIPASEIVLLHNMRPLQGEKRPLSEQGIAEGDILLIDRGGPDTQATAARPSQAGASAAAPGTLGDLEVNSGANAAALRDNLLANPQMLAALRNNYPPLADAVHQGLDKFKEVFADMQKKAAERKMAHQRMLSADPFDPEAQQLIAEHIRLQNVNSNMEAAMEYHPESFGIVTMLYINCRVNGHPVKAFVDSGAQSTIISSACAERCGIMRLVDPRWAGIAKGVGTQKIIGRIHLVDIEIEKDYLNTNFSVLEDQTMDMLLGLDMLKRHQCVIDLKRNCLVIGTTGTETRFLPESELPACARVGTEPMDEDLPPGFRVEKNAAAPSTSNVGGAQTGASASGKPSTTQGAQVGASSSAKAPSATGAQGAGISNGSASLDEKTVSEICALGFKREDAVRELANANGDKNKAIGALFAKSFVIPK